MTVVNTHSVTTLNNNQESPEKKEFINGIILRLLTIDAVRNFQEMLKQQAITTNHLTQAVADEQKVLIGNVIQPVVIEKHAVTRDTPVWGIFPAHTTTIEDNMEKLSMDNMERANTITIRGLSEMRMQGLNKLSEVVGTDMNAAGQLASTTIQLCTTINDWETDNLKKAVLKTRD